ncbi:hypothetical protein ACFLTI_04800 [Bacteroidota bacterium]
MTQVREKSKEEGKAKLKKAIESGDMTEEEAVSKQRGSLLLYIFRGY